MITDF